MTGDDETCLVAASVLMRPPTQEENVSDARQQVEAVEASRGVARLSEEDEVDPAPGGPLPSVGDNGARRRESSAPVGIVEEERQEEEAPALGERT